MRRAITNRGTRALLVVVALASLATAGVAASLQDEPDQADQAIAQIAPLFADASDQYPPIVARVNGQEISGVALAQRVYFLEQNSSPGQLGTMTVEDIALKRLIEERVLLGAADELGIHVTEREARAEAERQEQTLREIAGDGANEMLAEYADQLGVPPDEFMTDPRTIEAMRVSLLLARVQVEVVASANSSTSSPQTQTAHYQDALDAFVQERIESLEIYIESSLN